MSASEPDPLPLADPREATPCTRYIGPEPRRCGAIPTTRFLNNHLCVAHAPIWIRRVDPLRDASP